VLLYKNGNTYDGEWCNDKKNGRGKQTSSKKEYDGDRKANLRHGDGIQIWKENTKLGNNKLGTKLGNKLFGNKSYEGQWLEGKKHGQGTMIVNNNIKYKGMWKDGKKA